MGAPSDATAKLAFFDFGQLQLELIEPDEQPSVWRDYLNEHGESVHHIAFMVQDTENVVKYLADYDIAVLQQGLYSDGTGVFTYVDSAPQLGVMLELLENFWTRGPSGRRAEVVALKTHLVPVYLPGRGQDFDNQVEILKNLLGDIAEFREPAALGAPLPDADAVVFPQMLGEAYRMAELFKAVDLPILIITSEFGTMAMWDWEIASYLRAEGIEVITPYSLDQTRKLCRALGVRHELRTSKFLVFQDNPGEGFQASIFKRFYWWEDECTQRMFDRFGITIHKKSFRELGRRAMEIPDGEAEAAWEAWRSRLQIGDIPRRALNSALKIYLAVKQELDRDETIKGVGINCLNESHFSDTTPCLAWNMLYEERRLIWGCEADTVSMLTKHILNRSLAVPIMMTNLYPFLMGQAALKHERIEGFPDVPEPENHILVAHCGYLGVLPQSFATEWTLRRKVLAIVNDNATAIDARLPIGDITLAKLDPTFERITVVEGSLEGYAQYPGSDCLNGAVLKIPNGRSLMARASSHHYLLMTGHQLADIDLIGKVFRLRVESID